MIFRGLCLRRTAMGVIDDLKSLAEIVRQDMHAEEERKNREEDEKKAIFLKCPYCGAQNRIIWKEGALPKCPNCGGEYNNQEAEALRKAVTPSVQTQQDRSGPEREEMGFASWLRKNRMFKLLFIMIGVLLIIAVVVSIAGKGSFSMHMSSDFNVHLSGGTGQEKGQKEQTGQEPADHEEGGRQEESRQNET